MARRYHGVPRLPRIEAVYLLSIESAHEIESLPLTHPEADLAEQHQQIACYQPDQRWAPTVGRPLR